MIRGDDHASGAVPRQRIEFRPVAALSEGAERARKRAVGATGKMRQEEHFKLP